MVEPSDERIPSTLRVHEAQRYVEENPHQFINGKVAMSWQLELDGPSLGKWTPVADLLPDVNITDFRYTSVRGRVESVVVFPETLVPGPDGDEFRRAQPYQQYAIREEPGAIVVPWHAAEELPSFATTSVAMLWTERPLYGGEGLESRRLLEVPRGWMSRAGSEFVRMAQETTLGVSDFWLIGWAIPNSTFYRTDSYPRQRGIPVYAGRLKQVATPVNPSVFQGEWFPLRAEDTDAGQSPTVQEILTPVSGQSTPAELASVSGSAQAIDSFAVVPRFQGGNDQRDRGAILVPFVDLLGGEDAGPRAEINCALSAAALFKFAGFIRSRRFEASPDQVIVSLRDGYAVYRNRMEGSFDVTVAAGTTLLFINMETDARTHYSLDFEFPDGETSHHVLEPGVQPGRPSPDHLIQVAKRGSIAVRCRRMVRQEAGEFQVSDVLPSSFRVVVT